MKDHVHKTELKIRTKGNVQKLELKWIKIKKKDLFHKIELKIRTEDDVKKI
jgi:hypothetical protein